MLTGHVFVILYYIRLLSILHIDQIVSNNKKYNIILLNTVSETSVAQSKNSVLL